MTDRTTDDALTGALREVARRVAPAVVAEAVDDARAEVRIILRERLVAALLAETASADIDPGVAPTGPATDRGTVSAQGADVPGPGFGPGLVAGLEPTAGGAVGAEAAPRRDPGFSGTGRPPDIGADLPEQGVYVYGFTVGDARRLAGLNGVDRTLTYPVISGALAAVVSDVTGQRRWGVGADGEADLALLAPRLDEHERVLEAIIEHHSVLPMRFGTLYASRDAVRDVLSTHGEAIGSALARLDGKVEWGLTVTWDSHLAGRTPGGHGDGPETPVLYTVPSPGRAYLGRREAEMARAASAAERRSQVARELHGSIEAVSVGSVLHPLPRRSEDDAETVLRSSYLVDKADRSHFEAVIVTGLNAGADLGLRGELTGPWPPYNFCGPEIERLPA